MKNSVTITGLTYALLLLVGGLIGYLKAGSAASLIASSCAAVLMLFSMVLSMRNNPFGLRLSSLVTLILLAFFSYRWWLTGALMPSGIMMFVSLVVLFFFISANPTKKP